VNARYSTAVAAILVVMSAVAPAAAQDGDGPRPSDSLFGPRTVDASARQTFDATLFLSGAYDANEGGDGSPLYARDGLHQLLSGTASYLSRGERVQWGAGVGSSLRYQNSDRELLRVSDYGAFGIAARVGRRWNVSASQALTCSVVNFQGLIGMSGVSVPGVAQIGGALPAGGDYASASGDDSADRLRACSFETGGGIGLTLSQRSTIEFRGGGSLAVFEPRSGYQSLPSYFVGGRLLHSVSPRARVNIGYTRRTAQFGVTDVAAAAADGTVHDIDIGLDYRRPLSLTRRTSVDFSAGPTAITESHSGVAKLRYGLTGGASLNHQFLRTWGARLGYSRGVSLVPGLTGPAFSDGVTVSLSGLLSRRIQFFASGDTRIGQIAGYGDEESAFTAHYATARLQVALARNWALSSDYTYYANDFAPGALSLALPFSQGRHAARVGLTWWIPIVSR
jgi:hypothetical protein